MMLWMCCSAALPAGVGVAVVILTSCKKEAKTVTNATNPTTTTTPTVTPGTPTVGQPQ